ncbi:uncharacterized protein EV420DRAFT_1543486 [Desarmillaria tabescens]|uniref:Uncharacterized protein n=1 Tax=Armillaria tabescens TaxID=1929756 RepID=A0AA39N5W7_ARMTA|nr:uncharacterized protein EV420DRAFT_1543486 [Desarmillaria tabescens]KAK0458628.1 hypothetical protein EV420DRAFT_1543486 [Desarmillaria tabescens]
MASDAVFKLRPCYSDMEYMHISLLECCLQADKEDPHHVVKPVRGMERKVERLLRFLRLPIHRLIITDDVDSSELTAAIHSAPISLQMERPPILTSRAAFFKDIVCSCHSLELPPLCWSRLMTTAEKDGAFTPLDPNHDHHANTFPLHLCSAILYSFHKSLKQPKHGFISPLTLTFSKALPYFPDKIYNHILTILSQFVGDLPLDDSLLRKHWRVFAVAIKFLLHRLSLPESDMSYTTILASLTVAVEGIWQEKFLSQEANTITTVLEGILVTCATIECDPCNVESLDKLHHTTIRAYWHLLRISPSACSEPGLQVMVDFMTVNWEQHLQFDCYESDEVCWALARLLANHVPAAYAVFHERQCLDFFGSHTFHEASIPVISEYIAGISAMQHGLVGIIDKSILQKYVNQLYESCHLFTACLILATYSAKDSHQTVIHNNITSLVQLCPHDTVWNEFYDGADFFTQQRIPVSPSGSRQLEASEIMIEKDNIRYAIEVLKAFSEDVHSGQRFTLPILGWCIGHRWKNNTESV